MSKKKRTPNNNNVPYTPLPFSEPNKPSPLMSDNEWRRVARMTIRLRRLA